MVCISTMRPVKPMSHSRFDVSHVVFVLTQFAERSMLLHKLLDREWQLLRPLHHSVMLHGLILLELTIVLPRLAFLAQRMSSDIDHDLP